MKNVIYLFFIILFSPISVKGQEMLSPDSTICFIDSKEADFLFELNDAVTGKDNDCSWNKLFVRAIVSYLLEDELSPGEIDDEEADWLYNKIKGDGQIDTLERELLLQLKSQAKNFPAKLEELL